MKINILLDNNYFNDHCTFGFIYPIIKSINLIRENGVNIQFIHSVKESSFDCDTLIIDSRFCGKLKKKKKFIDYLQKKKKKIKLIFADTADNSGQLKIEFLQFVDIYWKGQTLKNLNAYMKPHYGGRLFTNFYRKKFNIKDKNKQVSTPVKNKNLLKKIEICWNMGLCDHGRYSHIKQKLFSVFKFNFLVKNTNNFFLPNKKRNLDISCRIGKEYDRETVSFQRQKISELLGSNINTYKLSRFKYLNELSNAKYTISPFGWGELCPRDFETFINGGVLIKPDMETINTWPNWYITNKTYLAFDWDLKNFLDKIELALNNYEKLKEVAINAQKKYLYYTLGKESKEIFAERFLNLIKR